MVHPHLAPPPPVAVVVVADHLQRVQVLRHLQKELGAGDYWKMGLEVVHWGRGLVVLRWRRAPRVAAVAVMQTYELEGELFLVDPFSSLPPAARAEFSVL